MPSQRAPARKSAVATAINSDQLRDLGQVILNLTDSWIIFNDEVLGDEGASQKHGHCLHPELMKVNSS